jgi:hypothetical protein
VSTEGFARHGRLRLNARADISFLGLPAAGDGDGDASVIAAIEYGRLRSKAGGCGPRYEEPEEGLGPVRYQCAMLPCGPRTRKGQ